MRYLILSLCLLGFWQLGLSQLPVPPAPRQLVTDNAAFLSDGQRHSLEHKLVAYNDSTSTQIAILTEQSLRGEDDFERAFRVAESWGIGQADKDNGVLIYIAKEERRIRIVTGRGVEGFLTDAMAKRIIEQVIKPAFRAEQYYAGLNKATDIIIQLGNGEFTADGIDSKDMPLGVILFVIIFVIFIFIIAGRSNNGDGGYHGGGRYDSRRGRGPIIIWGPGNGGGGGFDGGGGGFGGFGGFGGGGFGGGGAGGGW